MIKQTKLNLFDLTMIVVALVIGMGIFRTPVTAAAKAGTPAIFYLAWLTGGLVALCGALTYAEIGSRYPVTGGYYKVFSYSYHPSVAFAINCIILLSNAASVAGVGVIGAEYIGRFFYSGPAPEGFKQFIAIGAVVTFYAINMLGLKMSSRVQNVLTIIKITLVLLLMMAFFGTQKVEIISSGSSHLPPAHPGILSFFKSLGVCLIAVSFTYGGYQQTINFGGDVKEPNRIMPRGISFGIAIIILLYLSLNFVYVHVIGFEKLKSADSIAAILIEHLFGPVGETVLRVLMFLSVLAYVNVTLMSNPRVMYAMSEEGILPRLFRIKTKQTDVILYSLTAFALTIITTLFFTSTFEKILNYSIFLDCIGMSTSAATLFILRRRKMGEQANIFRMKLYPLLPMIFILVYILVALSVAIDDWRAARYGSLLFLGFFALYFVARLFGSKKEST
jgi:basic amino acid/polyamine antiporter, APA family